MTKEDVKGSSIREKKADKKEEEGQRGCLSGQTAAFPSRLTPLAQEAWNEKVLVLSFQDL